MRQTSPLACPPFHLTQGHDPWNPYSSSTTVPDQVPAAAHFMTTLSSNIKIATDALTLAKAHQEKNANKSQHDVMFEVGDQVLLNSHHVHLASQALCPSKKLQHWFIGPYPIVSKVSPVAYRLALPPDLHIHPVFHVSLL